MFMEYKFRYIYKKVKDETLNEMIVNGFGIREVAEKIKNICLYIYKIYIFTCKKVMIKTLFRFSF